MITPSNTTNVESNYIKGFHPTTTDNQDENVQKPAEKDSIQEQPRDLEIRNVE